MARRIQAAVHCSVAALPTVLRQRASTQLDGGGLSRLSGTMAAWCRGLGLGKAAWAERMLGRDAADPVAGMLHKAALAVASGERDGVRQAAESLAAAMQVVGLDRWPRFVADAQARASANARLRLPALGKQARPGPYPGPAKGPRTL